MTIVSIVAAVIACLAAGAAIAALLRMRAKTRTLEEEIERGQAHFDEVLSREAEVRAAELEQNLALARSQALSVLAEEERRITEERRRDVAERERDATAKLVAALTDVQRSVEQRFADWGTDVTTLQQSLASELERIGQRQQQLVAGIETKIDAESERFESALEEHRARIARTREDLDRAVQEVAAAVAAELEAHAAERRRELNEVAERLRRRERELQEQIDHEQSEATQRVAIQLQDVERRQLEQVRRARLARDPARSRGGRDPVRRDGPQGARGCRTPACPRARALGRAFCPPGGGGDRRAHRLGAAGGRDPDSGADPPAGVALRAHLSRWR